MGVREWRCLKEEEQRLWNWTVSKSLFVFLFVYRIILIFLKLLTTLSFHWKHIVLVCTWYHFKHEISFYMILLQPQIQSAWLYDNCESFVDDSVPVVIFLILYFVSFYFARRPFFFFSWSLNRSFGLPVTKFSELIFPREASSVSFGIELVLFRCTQYICSILQHKLHFDEFNICHL